MSLNGSDFEDKKEDVLEALSASFARGDIREDEYERRVELAGNARDAQELSDLFPGLVAGPSAASALRGREGQGRQGGSAEMAGYSAASAPSNWDGERENDHTLVSIFSGSDYVPGGVPAKRVHSINVFGGGTIDLRDCYIPPEGLTISVVAVFGGCDVYVPPGVRVKKSVFALFGGADNKAKHQDPRGPEIRVEGVAIFGGIDIKTKLPRSRELD